jgi:DNA-binding MarR family transcriptional regulator
MAWHGLSNGAKQRRYFPHRLAYRFSKAYHSPVAAGLPLHALLSQALVRFTIDFDNEFEHRMPHRTTNFHPPSGSRGGPWLVSLAMWSNCMQFVGEQGITVGELERLARTKTNLNGMQRWGYITIEGSPRSDPVIRATSEGRQAQEIWRPLFGEIEKRWEARYGGALVHQLRETLTAMLGSIAGDLPDCLPILGYGLFSRALDPKRGAPAVKQARTGSGFPLSALLSKVLLAFAMEFERESDLSLAISANVVRVLNDKGVRVRDLPPLSGVSKEAISVACGLLQKKLILVVEPNPDGSRAKIARLTAKGRAAQGAYHQLAGCIEERWKTRFGDDTIRKLRERLEELAGDPAPFESYADGWRAKVPMPTTLPHFPMVLHRGGFPDGS